MMLRAALGFFTRLPIGSAPLPPTFRGVAVWLPMVGLIIGAAIAGQTTVIWQIPAIEIGFVLAVFLFLGLLYSIFKSGRF